MINWLEYDIKYREYEVTWNGELLSNDTSGSFGASGTLTTALTYGVTITGSI